MSAGDEMIWTLFVGWLSGMATVMFIVWRVFSHTGGVAEDDLDRREPESKT